jgi:hypothetical protein
VRANAVLEFRMLTLAFLQLESPSRPRGSEESTPLLWRDRDELSETGVPRYAARPVVAAALASRGGFE